MNRRELDDIRTALLWTRQAVQATIYKAQCTFDPEHPLRIEIEREQSRRIRRLQHLIKAIDSELGRDTEV